MMLKGTLDTAVGIDWEKTMDKDTWEMEDYRKMASMAQFMVGAAGGAAASRYATRGTHNKTRVANEELGDFLKLLNRQNSEAAALAKARIPKLQENLLKRTAKIETQAGAAQKQKLVAKGKECCCS
jgi:histidinol dehydrogenase